MGMSDQEYIDRYDKLLLAVNSQMSEKHTCLTVDILNRIRLLWKYPSCNHRSIKQEREREQCFEDSRTSSSVVKQSFKLFFSREWNFRCHLS